MPLGKSRRPAYSGGSGSLMLSVHRDSMCMTRAICPFRSGAQIASIPGAEHRSSDRMRPGVIERLIPLLVRGDKLLVLGGNFTVALGVVAALRRVSTDPVGVLYGSKL